MYRAKEVNLIRSQSIFPMRTLLVIAAFACTIPLNAQRFIQNAERRELTFTELQQQFSAWSDTTNLQQTRGWKFFKRWEMEMLMHTDGSGEPGDPTEYYRAGSQSALARQPQNPNEVQYNAWYPVGPDYVP